MSVDAVNLNVNFNILLQQSNCASVRIKIKGLIIQDARYNCKKKIVQLNYINILHSVKCLNAIQELALEFHAKRVGVTPTRTKIKFIQLLFRRPISNIIETCTVTLYTKPEKGDTALLLYLQLCPVLLHITLRRRF
jgi:hypothetical protein